MLIKTFTHSFLRKMMLSLNAFAFFMIISASASFAPDHVKAGTLISRTEASLNLPVHGLVTDSAGAPLSGVTVYVKDNRNIGTITDMNGRYSLEASSGAILVFSALGYQSVERPAVSGQLDVMLYSSISSLDQLVVIGYGT
jgi:hypothetical protein